MDLLSYRILDFAQDVNSFRQNKLCSSSRNGSETEEKHLLYHRRSDLFGEIVFSSEYKLESVACQIIISSSSSRELESLVLDSQLSFPFLLLKNDFRFLFCSSLLSLFLLSYSNSLILSPCTLR
eukprot:TRINITY_DN391_c0_g2_i14.p1 TRINITY_DN391_c0_g2~~TRINITY_DN391_c0_g2_i14.p1  ORF type:complete len:124 (+),score=0.89 TRINITY_DN391_c0_g2_i14:660-1031(+)